MDMNLDKPVYGTGAGFVVAEHLDAIRDNFLAAVIDQGNATLLVRGWNLSITGANPAKPDTRTLTGPGGRKIRFTYTYTDHATTQIDIEYDDNQGGGFVAPAANSTVVITYDADGNPTSTAWS